MLFKCVFVWLTGDFAVLLKAGMTVKQAIVYNLLSALMAYVGMLIGTAVGQYTHNVTSWIFAITAGMFLYVALVDMVSWHSTASPTQVVILTTPAAIIQFLIPTGDSVSFAAARNASWGQRGPQALPPGTLLPAESGHADRVWHHAAHRHLRGPNCFRVWLLVDEGVREERARCISIVLLSIDMLCLRCSGPVLHAM